MEFKDHLERAWKTMLEHIASLLILTLVTLAVSFFTLGILAPVAMAGYVSSVLLLLREGREPKAEDVFSQMRLFVPLLLFGLTVLFGALVGFALLFLPGVLFLLAASFCCLYLLPLLVDGDFGLIDAVKESYSMVTERFSDQVVVFLIFAGINAVGGFMLPAALVTLPLATIFLISVYLNQKEEKLAQVVHEPSAPD